MERKGRCIFALLACASVGLLSQWWRSNLFHDGDQTVASQQAEHDKDMSTAIVAESSAEPLLDFVAACRGVPDASCTAADRLEYWMQKFGHGCHDHYELVWRGRNLTHDQNEVNIPSMSQVTKFLVMTGAAVSAGAAVVEMGTFFGAGSLALAAGLSSSAESRHGPAPYLHGFDFFQVTDIQVRKIEQAWGHSLGVGDSTASFWVELTKTVYPHVEAHAGAIGSATAQTPRAWGDTLVDVFSIDSAKTHDKLKSQSMAVWQKLRKGSVIVFMDFMKTSQPLLVYHVLQPAGMVKLVWHAITSSPVAFAVTTEDHKALKTAVYNFRPDKVSSEKRHAAAESYLADMKTYAAVYLSPNERGSTGKLCNKSHNTKVFFSKMP